MGFTSTDNFLANFAVLNEFRQDWTKNWTSGSVMTTATWYDLYMGDGSPSKGTYSTAATISATWSMDATTTATITLANHGFVTGCYVVTTGTSDGTHLPNSIAAGVAITVLDSNTFTLVSTGSGGPANGTINISFANLCFYPMVNTSVTASGIQHGPKVSPMTKHLVNSTVLTGSATVAPNVLMLTDLLGFVPITTVTSTSAQSFVNTISFPRYTNGKGVQAYLVVVSATGAGAGTLSLNYTNSDGVSGRTTPNVSTLPTVTANSPAGAISHSGNAVGKYNFFPLNQGEHGIQTAASITFGTSMSAGTVALVFCRPLLTLPLAVQSVSYDKDYLNQFTSLPRIYDGAVLNLLSYAQAATPINSSFSGNFEFGWG